MIKIHVKSRMVGMFNDKFDHCPCCNNYLDKKKLKLTCNDSDLSFLGPGISLYFSTTKYFALFIYIILMITGSF